MSMGVEFRARLLPVVFAEVAQPQRVSLGDSFVRDAFANGDDAHFGGVASYAGAGGSDARLQ